MSGTRSGLVILSVVIFLGSGSWIMWKAAATQHRQAQSFRESRVTSRYLPSLLRFAELEEYRWILSISGALTFIAGRVLSVTYLFGT
jgi:hypothetical protein